MEHPARSRHLARTSGQAGFSVGTVLLLCVLLLLAVVGLLGYAWYKTQSKSARLEDELRQVRQEQRQAEIDRSRREAEELKAAEAAKLTVARDKQEAFAHRIRGLTNTLEKLLVQVPGVQDQLEKLRTGEEGKQVALFEDLVVSARTLFEREAKDLPTREETVQRLESMRRLLLQIAESVSTTFEPSSDMLATLDTTQVWTEAAVRRLQLAKGIADTLARESKIKVPPANARPPTVSLQDAINTLTQKEWDERQRIERAKTVQAERKATETIADAKTNQIINQAQMEAERLKKEEEVKRTVHNSNLAGLQSTIDETKLRAEAQSSEVRNLLAPFLSPGMWDPSPNFGPNLKKTPNPRPMSYSALMKSGCLDPSTRGLQQLYKAAMDNSDKMRPRWSLGDYRRFLQDAEKLARVNKAQDYLIRLGPTMVKTGMLDP